MVQTDSGLRFVTDFDPRTGEAVVVAPGVARVTAPNRSAYTFTGTNSYLLGTDRLFVVDPGPRDARHLHALLDAVAGRPVVAVLLTHTHRDHSALARRFADIVGAPVWFGGRHRLSRRMRPHEINPLARDVDWSLVPDRTLRSGESIAAGGLAVEVVATPGHCANHLAYGIVGTDLLLTGDHVMGWNSTLVPVPDGSMEDYLASLDVLIAGRYDTYLPGHGGAVVDGRAHAVALRAHRQLRNQQILACLDAGPRSLGQIVAAIYPGLSPALRRAARMTVEAHVDLLEDRGAVVVARSVLRGTRVRRAP